MKITWLYTGEDGRSHFQDVAVPLHQDGNTMRSALFVGTGAAFGEGAAGDPAGPFHNAPRRQWVVILTGAMEVGIGDGTVRRFGPGEVFLADDVTGQGHTTRTAEGPRCIMTVPVTAELDPRSWEKL